MPSFPLQGGWDQAQKLARLVHRVLETGALRVRNQEAMPNFTLDGLPGKKLHLRPGEQKLVTGLLRRLACGPYASQLNHFSLAQIMHDPSALVVVLDARQTSELTLARFSCFLKSFLVVLARLIIVRLVTAGTHTHTQAWAVCTSHVLESHGLVEGWQNPPGYHKPSYHIIFPQLVLELASAGVLVHQAVADFARLCPSFADLDLSTIVDFSIYKKSGRAWRAPWCNKAERRPCASCSQEPILESRSLCASGMSCPTLVWVWRTLLPFGRYEFRVPDAPTFFIALHDPPLELLAKSLLFRSAGQMTDAEIDEFVALCSVGETDATQAGPAWRDQGASALLEERDLPRTGILGLGELASHSWQVIEGLLWGSELTGKVRRAPWAGPSHGPGFALLMGGAGRYSQVQMSSLLLAHVAPYLGVDVEFGNIIWDPRGYLQAYTIKGTAICPFRHAVEVRPWRHSKSNLFVTLSQTEMTVTCFNKKCTRCVCKASFLLPESTRHKLFLKQSCSVFLFSPQLPTASPNFPHILEEVTSNKNKQEISVENKQDDQGDNILCALSKPLPTPLSQLRESTEAFSSSSGSGGGSTRGNGTEHTPGRELITRSARGCSKIACSFSDSLEKANPGWKIQHLHFAGGSSLPQGSELRVPGSRFKVDGYDAARNCVYEFHGNIFHGFPPDHPQHAERRDLYRKTMSRMFFIRRKMPAGCRVFYAWEHEVRSKPRASATSLLHELPPDDDGYGNDGEDHKETNNQMGSGEHEKRKRPPPVSLSADSLAITESIQWHALTLQGVQDRIQTIMTKESLSNTESAELEILRILQRYPGSLEKFKQSRQELSSELAEHGCDEIDVEWRVWKWARRVQDLLAQAKKAVASLDNLSIALGPKTDAVRLDEKTEKTIPIKAASALAMHRAVNRLATKVFGAFSLEQFLADSETAYSLEILYQKEKLLRKLAQQARDAQPGVSGDKEEGRSSKKLGTRCKQLAKFLLSNIGYTMVETGQQKRKRIGKGKRTSYNTFRIAKTHVHDWASLHDKMWRESGKRVERAAARRQKRKKRSGTDKERKRKKARRGEVQ